MLRPDHIQKLKETSGLSEKVVLNAGLESFDESKSNQHVGSSRPGIAFPYYSLSGDLLGYRVKLDKVLPDGGKYLQKKNTDLHLYFVPKDIPSIVNASKILHITEGEKKCLALREALPEGSAVCSIPGCWSWSKNKELAAIFNDIPLNGRAVTLVVDSDYFLNNNVREGYNEFIKCLLSKEAKVDLIDLRRGSDKLGVDDFILKEGVEELKERLSKPFWTFDNNREVPRTLTINDIKDILKSSVFMGGIELGRLVQSIKAYSKDSVSDLKKEHRSYVMQFEKTTQTDRVPQCFWDPADQDVTEVFPYISKALEQEGSFYICPKSSDLLWVNGDKLERIKDGGELSKILVDRLRFYKSSRESSGYRIVPRDITSAYLTDLKKHSKLKPLTKLAAAPVFVNGKLIHKPGYYREEQTLYIGNEIQPKYTFEKLNEVASYFPTQTSIDKTHIIASLISPVFNQDFKGMRPFFIIRGDDVNLGKTSLAHICSIIHTGHEADDISYTHNDEELEKRVSTQILKSDFILIDNINSTRPVSSAVLERSVTASELNYRLLGSNKTITRENIISLFMTLNSGEFSPDLVTRALPIFLSYENRGAMPSMFNPKKYAHTNREEILREIVGLIKKWECEGKKNEFVKFPKFPEWAATLNSILKGMPLNNFLSNFNETSVKLDPISSGLIELAEEEFENYGGNKTQVYSAKEWRVKLEDSCGNHIFNSNKPRGKDIQLGKHLKHMVNKSQIANINEREVKITLKLTNIESGGANKAYYFELEEAKAPEPTKEAKDVVTVTPNDSWFDPQEGDGNYSYEFNGRTYESKWWEGETLKETFCFDLETEKDNPLNIKLVSAFDGERIYRVEPHQLKEFLDKHKNHIFICHNSEFDIGNLLRFTGQVGLGLTLLRKRQIKDTLALSRLISLAEGRTGGNDLGTVTKRYLDIDLPKDVEIKLEGEAKPKKVSLSYGHFNSIREAQRCFLHYNSYDVLAPYFVWDKLVRRAKELSFEHGVDPDKLLSYYHLVSTGICGVITSHNGIGVDQEGVQKKKKELEEQKELALVELRKFGYDPESKKTEKRTKDYVGKQDLFGSIMQKLEAEHGVNFAKKYHKGRKKEVYSAKTDDLKEFKHIDFVKYHLEYERVSDILSTFISPLIGKDRIHTTYKAGKNSGRISSTKPNLQNLPRGGGIRDLYVPAKGNVFVIADYSGAELQVAGQYCLDNYGKSHFAEMLNKGVDVHRYVAAKYLRKPECEVTKEDRAAGKPFNFGRLAGSGALTLQLTAKNDYGVNLTLDESKELINVWDTLFPEAKEHFKAANRALEKALGINKYEVYPLMKTAKGETQNLTEKQINWAWEHINKIKNKFPKLQKFREDIVNRKSSHELERALQSTRVSILPKSGRVRGGIDYSTWCNNAALQGGQADITNTTWRKLLERGLKVVNVVHDEFIVECSENEAKEVQKEVEETMLKVARYYNPDMTNMAVESAITTKWEKV